MTSTYPWSVSPQQIRFLVDGDLSALMRELLLAQAYKCRADISKVLVNTEDNAADAGCDAWTPPPPAHDPWLGSAETCWQFKAGGAGEPSKLAAEVQKRIPKATLKARGRFVVVTSKAGGGRKEHQKRLDELKKGARKAKIRTPSLEVLTSETLTAWTNEHPAIAAAVRGVTGAWPLKRWLADSLHKEPWHTTPRLDTLVANLRKALDFSTEQVTHVHVYGQPGAGKTRFVLEACREAPWATSVMYIPQAEDYRVGALLDSVADAPAAQLVLVVDEVPQRQVSKFNASVRTGGGRLRLITIGHDGSPDLTNIQEMEIGGLDERTMAKVVNGWHRDLPPEHVQFIVSFADGFVKLARLAADAIRHNPSIETSQLMALNDIRQLMDNMLGQADGRRALHVLAVLSSVGWTGKRATEGEAVASHLGLKWTNVQSDIEALHAKYGIAPRIGDLRYISPKPLGVYLALEALQTSPEKLRSLPDALPNDAARSAYYERFRAVVASPAARSFAEEELTRFSDWKDFLHPFDVERWAALTGADPTAAALGVRKALEVASHAERLGIANRARRHLVRALLELAWRADAFEDAVLALAELAEAENESWANNATGEFASKYQLILGGTACPYGDRLEVIDELLRRPAGYQRLAIAALARIGESDPGRWGTAPSGGQPSQPEWYPSTQEERIACAHAAFARLTNAAASAPIELAEALVLAVRKVTMLLRQRPIRDAVAGFLRAILLRLPDLREPLRLEVHRVLDSERTHWKQLGAEDLAWLERVHESLEDRSTGGQLRQALVQPRWERAANQPGDLALLATKLLADRSLLKSEWEWLTSGEAVAVWDLGEALARSDSDGRLLDDVLRMARGRPDLRIVGGYLQERAKAEADGWIDDRIDDAERTSPDDAYLIFQLTWRCAHTTRGALRLTRYARAGLLRPEMVAHLVFGGWSLGPDIDALVDLLHIVTAKPEFKAGALALVEQRLSKCPGDLPALQGLAIALVTTGEVLRTGSTGAYSWAQVARQLVPSHAREIVRTIYECQAHRHADHWFLDHSQAAQVLSACAKADPSGVWEELVTHLEAPTQFVFVIGFPLDVVSHLPQSAILTWVDEDPERRASTIARLIEKQFVDGMLGAELLHRYRKLKGVGDTFFAALVTGTCTGPLSQHWESLASQLDRTVRTSKLIGLRDWAKESATKLRRMAKEDRKREDEERLRC